jgi:hypothetical protein
MLGAAPRLAQRRDVSGPAGDARGQGGAEQQVAAGQLALRSAAQLGDRAVVSAGPQLNPGTQQAVPVGRHRSADASGDRRLEQTLTWRASPAVTATMAPSACGVSGSTAAGAARSTISAASMNSGSASAGSAAVIAASAIRRTGGGASLVAVSRAC